MASLVGSSIFGILLLLTDVAGDLRSNHESGISDEPFHQRIPTLHFSTPLTDDHFNTTNLGLCLLTYFAFPGCTLERLYSFIEEFSKRQPARKVTLDCLFNPDQDDDDEFLTKRTDDPNQYHEAETLDDEAKEKIWEALKADQDFSVGRNNEGKDLSWKEIKEDDTRRRQKRADDNIPDSNDGIPIPPQDNEPETQAKRKKKRRLPPEVIPMGEYEVWRVYTTEEKQWMTLTGHGIDRKKVPPTVFDLLAVIGKCRHAGILQPDLTRAAGQDPRSSSARTTLLADLGYIEKRSVLAARLRTSILTLKRFITPTQAETIFLDPSKAKPKETEQKGQTVDINVLTSEIFRVLGEAKNKTLMHCDLKKKLVRVEVDSLYDIANSPHRAWTKTGSTFVLSLV